MATSVVPVSVRFTKRAKADFNDILCFVASHPWGNTAARGREIEQAIDQLCYVPDAGRLIKVRSKREYRLLVVKHRFLVPYIYYPLLMKF